MYLAPPRLLIDLDGGAVRGNVLDVDFPGLLQIVSFEAFACLERCPRNGNHSA
jgi:hypothetical protein